MDALSDLEASGTEVSVHLNNKLKNQIGQEQPPGKMDVMDLTLGISAVAGV